jgi:hypothetical protein
VLKFALLALALASSPAQAARKETIKKPLEAKPEAPALRNPELIPKPQVIPPSVQPPPKEEDERPTIIKWMVHPLKKRGMFINLPIIDTDPNRGTTMGVLPIWVIPAEGSDRIQTIHAPSLTYNKDFKFIPTYRYYYYPKDGEQLLVRGSVSVLAEREALVFYSNREFLDTDVDFSLRGQYNVDGSLRFYGFGPESDKKMESDYTEDYIGYDLTLGMPVRKDSHWRVIGTNHFVGQKFYGGKINRINDISQNFPGVAPSRRQQVNETRAIVQYDSRDSDVTTSRGAFLQTFMGWSVDSFSSAFDYTRYGIEGRYFQRWSPESKHVTAAQYRYDQQLANAPFWLQSRMGGKYSLRAYGDGRYIDRGAMVANVEHRYTMFDMALAGVTTEFEIAPFFGMGSVFDSPKEMQRRLIRPVIGSAIRAIAKPQVVGSIDVGVGQEGVSVFMDINYSF